MCIVHMSVETMVLFLKLGCCFNELHDFSIHFFILFFFSSTQHSFTCTFTYRCSLCVYVRKCVCIFKCLISVYLFSLILTSSSFGVYLDYFLSLNRLLFFLSLFLFKSEKDSFTLNTIRGQHIAEKFFFTDCISRCIFFVLLLLFFSFYSIFFSFALLLLFTRFDSF